MKKMALILVIVGAMALATESGKKDDGPTVLFWLSAEAYHNLPEMLRRTYLSGWLDARLNAGLVGGGRVIQAQRECVKEKTITQILAIVDKYVTEHPATWDRPAATEADEALWGACPDLYRAVVDEWKRKP